jgi:hypothetical protein
MLPVNEASYAGKEFNIRTIPHAIKKIVTYDGEQKSATPCIGLDRHLSAPAPAPDTDIGTDTDPGPDTYLHQPRARTRVHTCTRTCTPFWNTRSTSSRRLF